MIVQSPRWRWLHSGASLWACFSSCSWEVWADWNRWTRLAICRLDHAGYDLCWKIHETHCRQCHLHPVEGTQHSRRLPVKTKLSGNMSRGHQIINSPYMADSVSGQDELNPSPWLATWTGKMEESCPLGTTRLFPQAKFSPKVVCITAMINHVFLSFSIWSFIHSRENSPYQYSVW